SASTTVRANGGGSAAHSAHGVEASFAWSPQRGHRVARCPGRADSHSSHSAPRPVSPQTTHRAGSHASSIPAPTRRNRPAHRPCASPRSSSMTVIRTDRRPILRAMLTPPDLDPRAVRRQFSRRAAAPGRADFLHAEIETRMLERLDLVRLQPRSVLDVGCGAGRGLLALKKRFPSAELLGLDASVAMARVARSALAAPARGLLARLRPGAAQ